ncbi:sigma factor [Actinomadura fulvescens]|uniref:RNA polymerase sigma factor SigJ n=1 Tax=Actinomadura fulvescens TaxID=46160 RepID=A0ABP6C1Z9_9ACTN
MNDLDCLAERFEADRVRLRAVAYRMLGSLTEADDAVQEAWLRLSRSDARRIGNLGGWLTTVVARVCLDMLRSRTARREEFLAESLPDPIVSAEEGVDPEQEAVLADSVGLALLVVLETRTPAAARQLASRARRRVQGTAPAPDPDLARQREVVDAFLAAARDGDFDALVAVLDPDVVLRSDTGKGRPLAVVRGAAAVARGALTFGRVARAATPALVNGAAGVVSTVGGRPYSVLAFTVADGRIVEIDVLADPGRVARLVLWPPDARISR